MFVFFMRRRHSQNMPSTTTKASRHHDCPPVAASARRALMWGDAPRTSVSPSIPGVGEQQKLAISDALAGEESAVDFLNHPEKTMAVRTLGWDKHVGYADQLPPPDFLLAHSLIDCNY
ncbi:hypothetical protein HDU82_001011 [Entophlyctis luteolus]|nr:hypothetical protein HDU82_001011 [Entophlyctis luteolus]